MGLSIFDLFKIGVGPSSSHTVGPMIASKRFVDELVCQGTLAQVASVTIDLFGSLALTGKGHATDTAIMLGLMGEVPETVDPDQALILIESLRKNKTLPLGGQQRVSFQEDRDLLLHTQTFLPKHPNGMTLKARDQHGLVLFQENYYSLGGGFVVSETDTEEPEGNNHHKTTIPHAFNSAKELLAIGDKTGLTIAEIVLENEQALGFSQHIEADLLAIWQVMEDSIAKGCETAGVLPGGLEVQRRAHALFDKLSRRLQTGLKDDLETMDWVSLFALAVNEENAAGGRVVTAPTNGAAGVIPAVLAYYDRFVQPHHDKGVVTFLATAAAIGMLYKKNASISAAEVGCQGEIGVACSMAAGALCAVLGGTNQQIENAAEIGMEHNLGLTCDPVAGLVQVPCIERNTMGAVKAINAARLALQGDGTHRVSLDDVIATMHQTGLDMQTKYKETALGGLAVNVIMC